MKGFLLDTNVISELTRSRPEPKVGRWVESTDDKLLYLSVLTMGEIRKGIAATPQPARRVGLETWLETVLRPWFVGRILPVDEVVADRWGLLAGAAGRPLPVIDGLLAATALCHDLTLVTRNTRDLAGLPVGLFNPWEN